MLNEINMKLMKQTYAFLTNRGWRDHVFHHLVKFFFQSPVILRGLYRKISRLHATVLQKQIKHKNTSVGLFNSYLPRFLQQPVKVKIYACSFIFLRFFYSEDDVWILHSEQEKDLRLHVRYSLCICKHFMNSKHWGLETSKGHPKKFNTKKKRVTDGVRELKLD